MLYDTPFVALHAAEFSTPPPPPTPLVALLPPLSQFLFLYRSAGPQILTVPSSEADAITFGYTGFQVTQLTVLRIGETEMKLPLPPQPCLPAWIEFVGGGACLPAYLVCPERTAMGSFLLMWYM